MCAQFTSHFWQARAFEGMHDRVPSITISVSAPNIPRRIRLSRCANVGHLQDLTAGFVAGGLSRTVTAPLERVKTEMQVTTQTSPGVQQLVRKLYVNGGMRTFFQGNLTNVIKVAPQTSLFFGATEFFRHSLPTRDDPMYKRSHSFIVGTLAGLSSQLFVYPLEPIKTRLTVAREGQYKGIIDCGLHVVRQGGVRSLFNGVVPTLVGVIPYAGTQRLVYDMLQRWYAEQSASETPRPSASFAHGLVSTSVGMAVAYPCMVVRTRLHMTNSYSGPLDCLRQTVAKEGIAGLFKGLGPNLAKNGPAAAVSFAVYDITKEFLRDVNRSAPH